LVPLIKDLEPKPETRNSKQPGAHCCLKGIFSIKLPPLNFYLAPSTFATLRWTRLSFVFFFKLIADY